MKKSSVSAKLWAVVALVWISLLALGGISAYERKETMLADRVATLDTVLSTASHVIAAYQDKAKSGEMSADEARKAALAQLGTMRYGKSGYIFVATMEPVLLLNPMRPELIGKNVGGMKDPKGNPTYVNIVNAARQGHGYVRTLTPKPGEKEDALKISAIEHVDGWDWLIGTGLYVDDIEAAFNQALVKLALYVLVAGGIASLLTLLIIRSIKHAIGGEPAYAAQIANRIADNDLTVAVQTAPNDRTSLLFAMKRMQEQLTHTIGSIKTSADSIATATQQIAAGNQDLSQRTEEQAASLQQTAASMEELTSTVNQNADNARQANQLAAQAVQVAEQGGSVVSRVVETMDGINTSSGKIANIVGIIEGIAFQTNILALNAAVEAARAGEQGRGFAVVASEVRSLAQRSATASKEIKELIQDSVQRVQAGSGYVQEAGATMDEITQAVKRVTDIMSEIAAASAEQSKGIGQVNQAVTQMDEVTQQNAALVEEAAAAASSLESQADELKTSVAMFRLEA